MVNIFEAIKGHPEYFKQLACGELLFTQYDCPQIETKEGLFSECNYICYVLSGKRTITQPGHSYSLTEGKCIFAKKGGWVARKGISDGWCVMIFFIPDNYLKQFVSEYRQHLPMKDLPATSKTGPIIEIDVNATTQSFFHSMVPYFIQSPPPPSNLLELKFRELVFNILINPLNRQLLSYLSELADCEKQPLAEIMEANYTYHLSLNDYAKLSHRSLASFKREFKEKYNTTPGKWLISKRLDYAGFLLNTTAKNLSDVVFESGFENNTHFSRVFKQRFGSSPLQFRKQNNTVVAD